MTLRDRVSMIHGVRHRHHHLRAGLGEHRGQIAISQLELGHQLREGAGAVFALALRQVERLVRRRNKLAGRKRVFRIRRDTDAECQVQPGSGGHRRGVHCIHDAIRETLRAGAVGVGDHHRKLIAAVSRDQVLSARCSLHDAGSHLKHKVSVLVAELVVHRLEVVEVDHQE